ncbi:MAG TPA: mechanosensitive ion channel domain-containing protein [Candidatus Acidoferrales bacterium]|nr:mechanosensitive ion channel domain-containing protein [Candidatus Acidoferrales bacterium]
MNTGQRLIFSGLAALLVLAAIGLALTHSWVSNTQNQVAAPSGQTNLVDQTPLQEAERLAAMAVTPAEQQYAQQALHFADNEVDTTFDSALRNATEHPPALTPAMKSLQEREARSQARVDAEQSNVTRLTQSVAQAPPARKDALQQQLALAQAQLSLDQDELADAQEDLARAGGDPRAKIQQMLQEHEQSEVHKGTDSASASSSAQELAVENTGERNLISQFRAWKSLNNKQRHLDAASAQALGFAAKLNESHEALESQLAAEQNPGSPSAPSANSNAAPQPSAPPADTAAAISRVRKLGGEQKNLASFDKRIEDEQSLAAAYGKWSALVFARERFFLHGLLVAAFWILAILVTVFLSDMAIRHFLKKMAPDRRKLLTLRSVLAIAIRAVAAVGILLIILGIPSQFATVLALAGAGLTVALKDFIVGFFGWFVLMGANGIRPGDWVEINGVAGEVLHVGLLHTVLLETGNWSDAGHPTGRKVTFVNSFAIEGHYFNFSTSGQWMWDELQISIPAGRDPYPIADEIKAVVAKETEKNARLAEKEWERVTLDHSLSVFKAEPSMSLRPTDSGASVEIRYLTRANERHDLRSRLYRAVLDLLHRKQIPHADEKLSPQPVTEAE